MDNTQWHYLSVNTSGREEKRPDRRLTCCMNLLDKDVGILLIAGFIIVVICLKLAFCMIGQGGHIQHYQKKVKCQYEQVKREHAANATGSR